MSVGESHNKFMSQIINFVAQEPSILSQNLKKEINNLG